MKHYFCLFFVFLFASEPLLATNFDDTTAVSVQSASIEDNHEQKQPQTWLEYCYENRRFLSQVGVGLLLMAAGCAYLYYAKKVVPGIAMDSVTDLTNPSNPLVGEGVANSAPAKSAEFDYSKHYGPESRALVDELREIHPLFGTICDKKYEYPFYCNFAVTKLEEMKQAGKKDYGSLQQVAGWHLDKSILDPVDQLNVKKEIGQNIDVLLSKKFAPQVPVQETVATPQVSGDETLKSDEMYPLWLALLGS